MSLEDDPSQQDDGLAFYVQERLRECNESCQRRVAKQLMNYDGWSEDTANEFVKRVAKRMRE